jgi:putative ABC transport system substrate-binding protein
VNFGVGKYGCAILGLLLSLSAVFVGFSDALASQTVEVAVVESRRMRAYDVALEGFAEAMMKRGFEPRFRRYVVDSDFTSSEELKETVEKTGAQIILALGTDAAKTVKDGHIDVPSLFSMVSEPGQSGLLNANNNGNTPMTGACLDVPVEEQFGSLLDVVPRARKIGVIYNPDESQFIVDDGRSAANRMNLGLVTYPIHSEAEVQEALSNLRPRIDALWLVSDRTVLTTQSLQYVFLFAFQTNLPLMGLSEHFVKMGALFAVGPDYRDVGMQSGEFAAQILLGKDPEELPIALPRKVTLSLNLRTAEIIGLRIPESVVRKAAAVY